MRHLTALMFCVFSLSLPASASRMCVRLPAIAVTTALSSPWPILRTAGLVVCTCGRCWAFPGSSSSASAPRAPSTRRSSSDTLSRSTEQGQHSPWERRAEPRSQTRHTQAEHSDLQRWRLVFRSLCVCLYVLLDVSTNGASWVYGFDASRSAGARWTSQSGMLAGSGNQRAGYSVALTGNGLILAVGQCAPQATKWNE